MGRGVVFKQRKHVFAIMRVSRISDCTKRRKCEGEREYDVLSKYEHVVAAQKRIMEWT